MGDYNRTEAKAINNNDWYLIALSYTMQRDFRDYLTMWAIPFSDKAATQVAGLGYIVRRFACPRFQPPRCSQWRYSVRRVF